MNKINVLFVIPSLCCGGAEKQVVDIVNGLSKEKFNVYLFTFEKELTLFKFLEADTIKFYHQPRRYKFDYAPAQAISTIINKEKIGVVYSSLLIAFIYALLGSITARRKTRLISSLHKTINRNLKEELFERLVYAPLMRRCDRIVTVCRQQQKFLAAKYPFLNGKFITIYNGIHTERFKDDVDNDEKSALKKSLHIQNGEFVIGMVAVLRKEKGHEYAFQAVRILVAAGIKIKLLLVGSGTRERYLRALSKQLGITQNIVWLGFQASPKKYISMFDIFLLASFEVETFSVAVLEALAMGKPVIATDMGGIAEQVSHGVTGYLIKPKKPLEIAEKIKYLVHNRDILYKLSNNARQSVDGVFSIRKTIEKTEGLLTGIVNS